MNNYQHQPLPVPADPEELHMGHFGAILFCALFLVSLAWMKSGFHFVLRPSVQTPVKMYTYDDAKAEVLAENGSSASDFAGSSNSDQSNQIAMLDPSMSVGAVLGASTGTADSVIPPASQYLTPELLNSITIKEIATSSFDSVRQYKEDVDSVENDDGLAGIMVDLTSQDKTVMKNLSAKINKLMTDLLLVSVPTDLVKFHKVKLLYYSSLKGMADGYAGVQGAPDPQDMGIEVFSLEDYLNNMKSSLLTTYGLPF